MSRDISDTARNTYHIILEKILPCFTCGLSKTCLYSWLHDIHPRRRNASAWSIHSPVQIRQSCMGIRQGKSSRRSRQEHFHGYQHVSINRTNHARHSPILFTCISSCFIPFHSPGTVFQCTDTTPVTIRECHLRAFVSSLCGKGVIQHRFGLIHRYRVRVSRGVEESKDCL